MAGWRSLTNPTALLSKATNPTSLLPSIGKPTELLSKGMSKLGGNNTLLVGALGAGANFLTGGALNALAKLGFRDPEWFIALHGQTAPFFTGTCGIDQISVRENVELPNSPMENGSFATFNIIDRPKELSIRFVNANEKILLAKQEQDLRRLMSMGIGLDVVTPTSTFNDFVIQSIDKTSTSGNGVNICIYDLTLREIQKIELAKLSEQKQTKNVTMTKMEKKGFLSSLKDKAMAKIDSVKSSVIEGINTAKNTAMDFAKSSFDKISGMF